MWKIVTMRFTQKLNPFSKLQQLTIKTYFAWKKTLSTFETVIRIMKTAICEDFLKLLNSSSKKVEQGRKKDSF
jgi:hypothetical protein